MSAYNNMEALVRALPFWQAQTEACFELLVADDGSSEAQRGLFQRAAANTDLIVRHIWHDDEGFDKCGILNKAILVARSPRLLFLDADMLPRFDLVENHLKLLKPGRFISGGSHINMNEAGQDFVASLDRNRIPGLFRSADLVDQGFVSRSKRNRLNRMGLDARLFDLLTWRTNAFSGANASCWKTDALKVNGFDEDWGYGGLDRDFGIRLTNAGVSSRRHQYSLVAIHQDHQRPYKDPSKVVENKMQLKKRQSNGVTKVEKGINRHAAESLQIIWENHCE